MRAGLGFQKNVQIATRNDDYEKRSGNEGGAPHHEVQINVDAKEKEINAGGGDNQYDHQQHDSYADNNQPTDEVREGAGAGQD